MERLQSTALEDADSRGQAWIKRLKNSGDDDDHENTNDVGTSFQAGQWHMDTQTDVGFFLPDPGGLADGGAWKGVSIIKTFFPHSLASGLNPLLPERVPTCSARLNLQIISYLLSEYPQS